MKKNYEKPEAELINLLQESMIANDQTIDGSTGLGEDVPDWG